MPSHCAVVLCVDDEENSLFLRQLVLAGYEVITARSAKEALLVISSQPVDLVLTDHLMPGATGAELARKLKSHSPGTKVILLSGVNEIPEGADAADAFISKLDGPDLLLKQIGLVLADKTE